ncbi:hypothetical protein N566_20705 [Streptomycetaceae bacterium MP113-05]|nr:hypothetical protein N566_20705 [Streptomycetaceae bacterium MP113-05]
MHRITPRLARRAACAAVAVPVLLVAGCSSDSDGKEPSGSPTSASASAPEQKQDSAGHKDLPDPCKTLSGKSVEDMVPGTDDKSGKNLASSDTGSYGACFWSGGSGDIDAEYRALTVSLKRYESDSSLGSGTEQASRFYEQELKAVSSDEAHKKPEETKVSGTGQNAVAVTYETVKKDNTYRATRVVVRDENVVVTVDYEGTGFEDADPPSRDEVRKNAEKVAKEATGSIE